MLAFHWIDFLLFLLSDILLFATISALLVLAFSYQWSWSRQQYRFAISSASTFLGFASWNLLEGTTGADQALNIDWSFFPLSWSDAGSGVAAFVLTAVALGLLTEREQPAWRVMVASAVAGLSATLVDLFAL
jgi:hypothetical protein